MKKFVIIAVLCVMTLPFIGGCFVNTHTIGGGPHSGVKEVHNQWYAVWGFIPIGDVKDGGALAGTTNCKITTKYEWWQIITNITIPGFAGLGATSRTIIIEK